MTRHYANGLSTRSSQSVFPEQAQIFFVFWDTKADLAITPPANLQEADMRKNHVKIYRTVETYMTKRVLLFMGKKYLVYKVAKNLPNVASE